MKKITLLCTVFYFGGSIPILSAMRVEKDKDMAQDHTSTKPGRVIFFTGPCSSGKSSLARLVAKRFDAKSYAFDEYVIPIITRKMVEKEIGKIPAFFITRVLPFNGFTLMNLISEKQKHKYQVKFYAELKKGLAIGPTIKMYNEVRKTVLAGRNVVVEAPLHLGDGVDCLKSLAALQDLDVSFVLVYCPWNAIIERIAMRNQSRNKKIHRELDWAVGNFLHYFDITPDQLEGAIDSVSGGSVRELVTTYSRPEFKKKRMQLTSETQQAALSCFKTHELYYLRPHLAYDLVINSRSYNPEEGATRVFEFLKNNAVRKFENIPWVN